MWKIKANFFYEGGHEKKVHWIEDSLYKKGNFEGKDTDVPLTREEIESEFRKLFLKYFTEKGTFSTMNIRGEYVFISFNDKLLHASLSVEEYTEGYTEDGYKVATAEDMEQLGRILDQGAGKVIERA